MKQPLKQAAPPAEIYGTADLLPAVDSDSIVAEPLTARPDQSRRRLAQLTAGVLLLALAITTALWLHFHNTHIITSNAMVRAHVSELGVRDAGVVNTIFVEAGDRVIKGQLLAQLDDQHLLARRASAEAALVTLDERIRLAETTNKHSTGQAAAELQPAERDSSQLSLDSITLEEAQLRVLRSSRLQAEAELAQVEVAIESTRIYAPADGAVIRRLAQPGMAVNSATPILSLWLTGKTWIEAWIPEGDLASVKSGNSVQVSLPALPGEHYSGIVARIGLATDYEMPVDYLPQSRESRIRTTPQVGLEIYLDSPPAEFRPGMSAVVDIRRNET